MTKPEPLTRQVGGTHYSKLAIQPLEFATANRYDPCAFSILKYVTRWRDKGGVKDLEKALHIAQIRATDAIMDRLPNRSTDRGPIPTDRYILFNNIPMAEACTLDWLDMWVFSNQSNYLHYGAHVVNAIESLIATATNETQEPV